MGKMLYLSGAPRGWDISIMDISSDFPAARTCPQFFEGDFTSYDDVIRFGQEMDIITIEIEKINVDALRELHSRGIQVFPQPEVVATIQDKGLQKEFFEQHHLPSSEFIKVKDQSEIDFWIEKGSIKFPCVAKARKGGYDGRGVMVIRSREDFNHSFQEDFIVEEEVKIKKEIAVITCRNKSGQVVMYDPVEMIFDPDNNILLYQIAPVEMSKDLLTVVNKIAMDVTNRFQIVGLLAIEMFVTEEDEVLINEVAPRPHNSGHHTIEACYTSQYENHLRAIQNLPLGNPGLRSPALMANLLGSDGHEGKAVYSGVAESMANKGVYVHVYGKELTKPFRKMGHVTLVGDSREELVDRFKEIRSQLQVIAE